MWRRVAKATSDYLAAGVYSLDGLPLASLSLLLANDPRYTGGLKKEFSTVELPWLKPLSRTLGVGISSCAQFVG